MDDLDKTFDFAVAEVGTITSDPGNDVKLRLYALFKQATQGDATGRRPGFANPVARAKHDAWAAVSGMSTEDAKRAYIEEVAALISDR